jgi:hypothetical protein
MRSIATVIAGALLAACNPTNTTKFPPGLEPVDPVNLANDPPPQGDDPFPETIVFVRNKGKVGDQEYDSVHGRGYVKAPLAKVWAAFQVGDAVTDRRNVDEWTTIENVETGYRVSFRVHTVVHGFITVTFDNTWREDVVQGSPDDPTAVAGSWQKTDGTSYIYLLAGSFLLRKVDASTTEVQLMEHLAALGKDASSAQSFLQDMFTSVVALAHDQPLPKWK